MTAVKVQKVPWSSMPPIILPPLPLYSRGATSQLFILGKSPVGNFPEAPLKGMQRKLSQLDTTRRDLVVPSE